MWMLFVPAVLSFLMLGAHYYRQSSFLLVGLCVATPLLLLVKRRAILRALQLLLVLCFGVWALWAWDTLRGLTMAPHPLLDSGIYLGVGGFALLAAVLLGTRPAKMLYPA